jgi:hypothetical protein
LAVVEGAELRRGEHALPKAGQFLSVYPEQHFETVAEGAVERVNLQLGHPLVRG